MTSGSRARRQVRSKKPGRHGDTQDEGAEDGVDADDVGEPRAGHQQDQHDAEHGRGDGALAFGHRTEHAQGPSSDRHDHQGVDHAPADGDHGHRRIVPVHGEHHGEDAPGDGVVGGAAGQGQGSQRRSRQPLFQDDAGQHREGGDRDRRAEEQHGHHRGDAVFEVASAAQQRHGDERAQCQRRQDAGCRDRHRGPARCLIRSTSKLSPMRNM